MQHKLNKYHILQVMQKYNDGGVNTCGDFSDRTKTEEG